MFCIIVNRSGPECVLHPSRVDHRVKIKGIRNQRFLKAGMRVLCIIIHVHVHTFLNINVL